LSPSLTILGILGRLIMVARALKTAVWQAYRHVSRMAQGVLALPG